MGRYKIYYKLSNTDYTTTSKLGPDDLYKGFWIDKDFHTLEEYLDIYLPTIVPYAPKYWVPPHAIKFIEKEE